MTQMARVYVVTRLYPQRVKIEYEYTGLEIKGV